MAESVSVARKGAICEITLDRPKANAIDVATSVALYEAFAAFRDDPALRVAIFTGAGERFFSAGWDLKAAAAGTASLDEHHGPGGFGGLTEFFDLNKPVIGAINGMAAGGGFELLLACDLLVAAEHVEFLLPEASIGLLPDAGGILRLPKCLPPVLANELMMTGRRMSAEEAARWGLVNRVVPGAELMSAAHDLAAQVIKAAPLSIAAIKEVMRATRDLSVERGCALMASGELHAYERQKTSEDSREGPRAFAEKRAPVWRGK